MLIDTSLGISSENSQILYSFKESKIASAIVSFTDYHKVYYPSSEEAIKLLNEYKQVCLSNTIEEDPRVISDCSNIVEYLVLKDSSIEVIASSFEENLNKNMYFTSSLGFKCNGDRRTRANIQDLITYFDIKAKDGHVSYRDYENVDHMLTKEQLQTLLAEHVANGQNLYDQKWEKQKALANAKSFDDLKAISTEFTMTDFTGVTIGA